MKVILEVLLSVVVVGSLTFWIYHQFYQPLPLIVTLPSTHSMITLTSSAFQASSTIPVRYTCDGSDSNPPLEIKNIPSQAKSLALIVDDPDSSTKNFVHWLIWNIKPIDQTIEEGSVPQGAVQGRNSFGRVGYGGPCPQSGTHRYIFKLLALDIPDLSLLPDATMADFNKIAEGHVLDYAILIGLYSR